MESLAEDLATMVRRPLTDAHVEAIRRIAKEVDVPAGHIFLRTGDAADQFYFVLDGGFKLWDELRDQPLNTSILGKGQFIGEIAFLTGGRMLYTMRSDSPAKVLAAPREAMLRLMAAEPEMSDIIVAVFAARRRAMLERNATAITVVGSAEDRAVRAVAAFAARNKLPLTVVDPATQEADRLGQSCSFNPDKGPS